MTGLIVALCALILLTVLLLLRVGVQVEYGRDGLAVRLRIGPGYLQILPTKPRKKSKKTNSAKPAESKGKAPSKGGALKLICDILPLVLRTVKRLCGKLQVDKLDMVLTAGAADPGDAALQYGRANAILGSLWQPIVTACRVVDGRARVDVDFDATHPEIYLLAGLSLRVGQILALAVVFAVQALIILIRRTKNATPN